MYKLFTNHCPDCIRAERLLKEKNIPFETIDIGTDTGYAVFKTEFMDRYTNRTMPVVMDEGGSAWPGYEEIRVGVDNDEIVGAR